MTTIEFQVGTRIELSSGLPNPAETPVPSEVVLANSILWPEIPLSREQVSEIVEQCAGLAGHLANRFVNKGEALEDLNQVAYIGLVKAVSRFDPGRGLQFTTYAVPTIIGELKRHFRDKGWALKVPRPLQEAYLRINTFQTELTQKLGRQPTVPELAWACGLSEETVQEAREAGNAYRSSSLDGSIPADVKNGSVRDTVADQSPAFEDDFSDQSEVGDLLSCLDERSRRIIYLRFYGNLTQSEIGKQVGISQMHVSRIITRSLNKMRKRAVESAQV